VNALNPHERYRYCYRVEFRKEARQVIFGWLVKTTSGLELGGGVHDSHEGYVRNVYPGDVYNVSFEFNTCLNPGIYYLNCGVSGTLDDYDGFMHRVIDAVAFRVRNVYSKLITGFTDFDYRSSFELLESATARHTITPDTTVEPVTKPVDGQALTGHGQEIGAK
jgi:lipopolysaccharide transport system ATP-binding protein